MSVIPNDFPAYLLDIKDFDGIKELPTIFRQGRNILMKHRQTGRFVTARFMANGFDDFSLQQDFFKEIWIQIRLRHPCIERFRGFTLLREDDDKTAALIYDYNQNGTLESLLQQTQNEGLTGTQKFKIAYGVAYAMQYIHSLHILHRNLKPSKVLLNHSLEPLVSDFSIAVFMNQSEEGDYVELAHEDNKGTPLWRSPEMMHSNDENKYFLTMKSDVFQYGQLLKCLITNDSNLKFNVDDLDNWQIIYNEEMRKYEESEDDLVMTYLQCVSVNPEERPPFGTIVQVFDQLIENGLTISGEVDTESIKQYQERVKNATKA